MRSVLALIIMCFGAAAMAAGEPEIIQKQLQEKYPEVRAELITPSPIPGLFEFRMGAQIVYVSADGRYLVRGDIVDAHTDVNISEGRRSAARLAAINDVGEANMIIFSPKQVKHTINVFTDVDCTYCRKLHREIDQYMARGIRVRYLFFPRSGPNTESWTKAEEVWCSADRNAALTKAKRGEVLTTKACSPNPVQQHFSLGLSFDVTGTPAIITDTGELLPGYVPPGELSEYLETGKAG